MKRATLLLAVLGTILVVVAWYLLVWSPRAEALTDAETAIVDVQAQQATTRSRIVALQGVREQAPQLQADLAAAESLLPRDTALPSALRQLQQAADASNATLVAVAPTHPEAIEGADGLYVMGLTGELRGTYFQIIDTLRRLEDPSISPRGLTWGTAVFTVDSDAGAPELIVNLSGQMFAVLPQPPAVDAGTAEAPATEGETTDGEAGDAGAEGEAVQ